MSTNGMQISAEGTVSQVHEAFQTPIYTYRNGTHTFFANARAVQVPAAIAPNIMTVTGIASAIQQQPTASPRMKAHQILRGFSATDIQGIYNVSPLASQGLNGNGQTVAIATFGDFSQSDIATFDQQYGFSGSVAKVSVDGGASLGSKNGQDETESDIEMIRSMAPGAAIVVYDAPNSNVSNQTAIDLYNRIVSDNRAQTVVTSWGTPESEMSSSDINAMDQILKEAAAQGQSFLAASGDSGAYDDAGNGAGSDTALVVDFPASDPWVTGVGGTSLQADVSQYIGETAWSDVQNRQGPVGGGGGLSAVFPRPSYQTGAGVDNSYSNGQRQVPDVSANADPNTGYAVYTVNSSDVPTWQVGGGTSAAAPLWAGFIAVVNQATGKRSGFLNPTLYRLGQQASTFAQPPFHDVTSGNNLYYPATPGWDFATGWGSFDGAAFVADLKAVPAAPATSTPVPTTTPRPTATSRPTTVPTFSPVPFLTISKVTLLHQVKGKLVATSSLRVGETGTLIILYQSKNASSLKLVGTVTVRQGGRVVKQVTLKRTTYLGKPALTAAVRFTAKSRVGTLLTRVAVTLGSIRTTVDRTFKLAL